MSLIPEDIAIEATAVSKTYTSNTGPRPVLRDVSMKVRRGEFVCIVGAMGSGKSTLLALLAGLQRPDSGDIAIAGQPLVDIPRTVGFVFQNYSLLPWFTAIENVRLAVDAARPDWPAAEQRARAAAALERVGLGNALHRRPRQLSGGMRQRVAIARALATEPEVLFLDEPFGALDALTRETLQADVAALARTADRQVTTVMVTNNVEEAILLADRIVPVVSGPPATLGVSIDVALPHPRTVAGLAHDREASEVRAHVVATLTASLGRRRSRSGATTPVGHEALLEVQK
jgi:ABC-type nitrate/sulfonate/bicarbonate transport system ATPase subunit